MLILDIAPSHETGLSAANAPQARTTTLDRKNNDTPEFSRLRTLNLSRVAAAVGSALVRLVEFALVAPMRRHMERKSALHDLTGFTVHNWRGQVVYRADQAARDFDGSAGGSDDAEAHVPDLPPMRQAYRPRRRTAYGFNAITQRAAAGMRRVRSVEPFARTFGAFEVEESQLCT